jgi:YD repeat-containing protein
MVLKNDNHFAKIPRYFGFDPVDLISGAYLFRHVDFQSHAEQGINWQWKWESASYNVSSLGNRIDFSYDSSLEIRMDDSLMIYTDMTGRRHVLPLVFDGDMYQDKQEQLVVENQSETYFIQKLGTKERYQFSHSSNLPDFYLLTEIQNNKGFSTKLAYDERDYLTSITDSSQNMFEVTYNDLGLISEVRNKNKILVQYAYTADGNLASVTDELGEKIDFTYDDKHLMIKRHDKNGISFHWQYDEYGRVTHTWGDGHLSEGWLKYSPDEGYNIIQKANQMITDSDHHETIYYYSPEGLVNQISYEEGREKMFIYDNNYRIREQEDTANQRITYDYDDFGLLTKLAFSDGTSELFEYGDFGVITQFVDRLEKATCYHYNELGRLSHITYDGKMMFKATYDERKWLASLSSDELTCDFSYNDFGKVIRKTTSLGDSYDWTYNAFGKCTSYKRQTATSNDVYGYQYDLKNRLIGTDLNHRSYESYVYDVHDNVLVYEKEFQETRMTYDKLDKITSLSKDGNTFEFSYNRDGDLTAVLKNHKKYINLNMINMGKLSVKQVNKGELENLVMILMDGLIRY